MTHPIGLQCYQSRCSDLIEVSNLYQLQIFIILISPTSCTCLFQVVYRSGGTSGELLRAARGDLPGARPPQPHQLEIGRNTLPSAGGPPQNTCYEQVLSTNILFLWLPFKSLLRKKLQLRIMLDYSYFSNVPSVLGTT